MFDNDLPFTLSTYLITRRCKFNCYYCNIKDNNYVGECDFEEKLKVIEAQHKLAGFVTFLGGDPFELGEELIDIVGYCTDKNIDFSMSSNTELTSTMAKRLIDNGLKRFTASIDMLNGGRKRSKMGYRNIMLLKDLGLEDPHATLVLSSRNAKHVVNTAKKLTKEGIWCEVTLIDWKRGEDYDFAPDKRIIAWDIPSYEEVNEVMDGLKAIYNRYIHNEYDYFDAMKEQIKTKTPYKCENPLSTLTVDSNGCARLCYRRNPKRLHKYKAYDLLKDDIREKFLKECGVYMSNCPGCLWDCVWQADYLRKNRKKSEALNRFKHKEV